MATKIAWTQETWNPVIGCSKCSPGCANCYAERMVHRLACIGKTQDNYLKVETTKSPYGWNGKTAFVDSMLEKPLERKKPTMYFVCSMGDLFHESVPFEWVDRVMAAVAICPRHTFQVLTKRPGRMAEYFNYRRKATPNLWLGVTCCTQEEADKNIPVLLSIQAAVRFMSLEPMLEGIDLERIQTGKAPAIETFINAIFNGVSYHEFPNGLKGELYGQHQPLDWVIVGCESGPGRRECKEWWIDGIVNQCTDAKVPVFVKQMEINGKVSHNMAEWPEHLRRQEYPEVKK